MKDEISARSLSKHYTKFGQLIDFHENGLVIFVVSYFKAKLHQIRFRLGLRPRPRWGSSQRSPRSPSGIKGSYFYGKERGEQGHGRGRSEGGREREGKAGREGVKRREGRG